MSIAIVIIVTGFGARTFWRSSSLVRYAVRSATELCVLRWEELSSRRRIDVDNNILLLVIPRSLWRVLLTIKTITCRWVEGKDQELCFSWTWAWRVNGPEKTAIDPASCIFGLYIILHLVKPKCSFKEITNGFKSNV